MNQQQRTRSSHPLFPGQTDKGPFIADQHLRLLVLPADGSVQAMDCFDPAKFREARRRVEEQGQAGEVELPEGCHWETIDTPEKRVALLANGTMHPRMLITIEAGIGKTTAIQQIMALRNCYDPSQLAIGARLVDLPDNIKQYLESVNGNDPWLVEQLRNIEELAEASPATLLQLIRRKLTQGKLTLVVDAFDQTGSRDVHGKVAALSRSSFFPQPKRRRSRREKFSVSAWHCPT